MIAWIAIAVAVIVLLWLFFRSKSFKDVPGVTREDIPKFLRWFEVTRFVAVFFTGEYDVITERATRVTNLILDAIGLDGEGVTFTQKASGDYTLPVRKPRQG